MQQSLPSLVKFFLVVVASFVLGSFTRVQYSSVPSVHDDHYFEWMIGEIRNSRLTLGEAAFTSHSGQMAPVGFLTYGLIFNFIGRDPFPWHTYASLMQAISAGLLFVVLRRYGISWPGPLLAALLWGSASFGRWDNALLWIAMTTTLGGPVLFLAAVTATSHLRSAYSLRWACAAAVATIGMISAWTACILFLPALLLQWLLLFRRTILTGLPSDDASYAISPRPMLIWLFGWVSALALSLGFTAWGLAQATQGVPHHLPPLQQWPTALIGAVSMLAVTVSDLTFWSASALATEDLSRKYLVMTLLLSGTFLLRPAARSIVLVFLTAAFTFSIATFLMRNDLGSDFVLTSGRYYGIPVLFWCAYIGMVVDGITARMTVRYSWLMFGAAILLLLAIHLSHQSYIAGLAVKQFDKLWTESIDRFDDQWKTAKQLLEAGAGGKLRIPEIPIDVPPVKNIYLLSTFSRLVNDNDSSLVEFDSIDQLSDSDLMRIQKVLGSIDTSTARDWHQTIRSLHEDVSALHWLDHWAKQNNTSCRLPNIMFRYGNRNVPLDDLFQFAFAEPLKYVKAGGSEEDRKQLIKQLARVDHPFARYWRQRLTSPSQE